MRELTDMGTRVIVAMLGGAALVGLAALGSDLLPRGGLPDLLGGWPMVAALAALLCGVCALGMSLGLPMRERRSSQPVHVVLAAIAVAWGVCLAAATFGAAWVRPGLPGLAPVAAGLAVAANTVLAWLLLAATLVGLLAGLRRDISATMRALTPFWLTPLWGGLVGAVYGLLAYIFYTPPPPHAYGLATSPWDGLRTGLTLGVGAGLALGLALALTLRLALIVRPSIEDAQLPSAPGRAATT